MSSSSSTATGTSRSSSPHTPEPSDSLDPVVIQSDFDINTWYQSDPENLLSPQSSWQLAPSLQMTSTKCEEEEQILHLDDLIQQHAYDDSPSPIFNSPKPPSKADLAAAQANFTPNNFSAFQPSNLFTTSRNERVPATRPLPPPASLPRKVDSQTNFRVVCPPKESCYNLAIMFPSLPEGGTKSRVETQVRVTVDLADSSSSSDPTKYDRVGSWKWLQLPRGTATKRRTRKQGKIDPDPQDILHLTATVTCASAPHSRVYSCTSCQTREAKRVAKKLAARVRPARSDSESGDDQTTKSSKGKQLEDTTSIIQFNCAEVQDFSSGSVVLPVRITCYCRHHREKVGFHVNLVMMDHNGRIVGTGTSKPIMITDDHKTPVSKLDMGAGTSGMDLEWSRDGTAESKTDVRAPSKRKKDATGAGGKKRAKPYDVASKSGRRSREASVGDSHPSPSSSYVDTRSPTPNLISPAVPLQPSSLESDSSGDAPVTPPDFGDVSMPSAETRPEPLSCLPYTSSPSAAMMQQVMPFVFFDSVQPSRSLTLPTPTIHRLIPNSGPTHGGTEVTILGANFHPSLQLDCIFGDVVAGSTQRWSDNTLVCILPPRATPGVVEVWFNNFAKLNDSAPSTSLFTYSDDSDRALMELALQVVGLKMTGKIEDAKNVAMRIVGNVGEGSGMQTTSANGPDMMQVTSTARSLRPLLLGQAAENESFESRIIKFLSILEAPVDLPGSSVIPLAQAISHPAPSGQTLLHLASFLGFATLVDFLVVRGADLDARDRNGYTALHFAAIGGSKACANALLGAGADLEVVNALGKTPQEIAVCEGLFEPESVDAPSPAVSADAEIFPDVVDLGGLQLQEGNGRLGPLFLLGLHHPLWLAQRKSSPPPIGDDKQALPALFALIQRTLAQLPGPQLRNLPALPQLPEMPAVPWGALPQIPMVFPVLVPWPAFLGGDAPSGEPREGDDETKGLSGVSLRAAQELRGTWEAWEKWLALAIAGATSRQPEEAPPPMYTPRAEPETSSPNWTCSGSCYGTHPPVTEQEVNAYGYVPPEAPKKHDRMLLFFWLPILLISLMWMVHTGLRTNKALRAFLLNRNSAEFIWRASFELVEGSPPKPPAYASHVEWTRLLFEEVCHVCDTTLEHDYSFDPIWWEFGARYCDGCCTSRLLAKKLPKKLTGSSDTRRDPLPAMWRNVFPRSHEYYLIQDIEQFTEKYSSASTEDKATLLEERRNQTKELTDYAKICRPWMKHIVQARMAEMRQLKDARWDAIQLKFCEAGWRTSLIKRRQWNEHEKVNTTTPLTDAEWNEIGPSLLKEFEGTVKLTVVRERFEALQRAFTSRLAEINQPPDPELAKPLAFSPRMVDVVLLPEVREVLEGNLQAELTVDELKSALDSKLPALLEAWSNAFETRLRDHTRTVLRLPPDVDPFKSALAYFTCGRGCCEGYFTGTWKQCRAWYNNYFNRDELNTYEASAVDFFHCKPWTVVLDSHVTTVLPDVIKHYGKDPQTVTYDEMDAAPGKLWCMRCVLKNQPTGWRDAVAHAKKFHQLVSSLKARWEVDIEEEETDE
ncbi:Protein MGA2 [Mycena sanguinolenta]|uniref:Protein MGA2 n=1 Tax=Mycena sanguinolenta TaxID=230812 RepID=A0A8H7DM96_9AGAR|nr:Protein MGA2 [Mycena sanguinolenta]